MLKLIFYSLLVVLGLLVGLGIIYLFFKNIEIIIDIIGLLIAYYALNTWRHHFKYQEKYKSLQNLEAGFRKRLKAFFNYRIAYSKAAKDGIRPEQMFELPELIDSQKSSVEYRDLWSIASSSLSNEIERNFEFNPDKVDGYLLQLLKPLHKRYSDEYDAVKDRFLYEIDAYLENGITAIRKLRE